MKCLRKHPFPVDAYFHKSLVLGYAGRPEDFQPLIPPCLALDLVDNTWAFAAVALVDTRHLRPHRLPSALGRDFLLIGYRIFVRYTNASGRRLRGLYILGSETNRRSMKVLGKLFTSYDYSLTDIHWDTANDCDTINSSTGLQVSARQVESDPILPKQSPFANWREARRFAGPMPFTFSFDASTNEVILVEGCRSQWTPRPMIVEANHVPFFDSVGLRDLTLANAFLVEQVPYHWRKGKVEKWRP